MSEPASITAKVQPRPYKRRQHPKLVGKIHLIQPFPPESCYLLWLWSQPVWWRIADDLTPTDPAAYVEWQEKMQAQPNYLSWGVYRGTELGGLIRFIVDPLRPWQGDIHVLFKKDFWGRPNVIPALLLVSLDLFGPRGIRKVNMHTFSSNLAVNDLITEIGGKKEGVQRRATLKGGKLVDMVLYGITPEDFQERIKANPMLEQLYYENVNAERPAKEKVN